MDVLIRFVRKNSSVVQGQQLLKGVDFYFLSELNCLYVILLEMNFEVDK